ncbi:MAG: phosphatidylglycerophosphatase A [Pyrinomonadaceae bacterium]|nr:phosphatidylglycerophosphatase A [Pyrinomonadaceae bacterium]
MPVIKESSDELNHPVVAVGQLAARGKRTARDYLALALATCGVGYLPLAPGTWGAAIGVALYLVFQFASVKLLSLIQPHGWDALATHAFHTTFLMILVLVVTLAGIWAASRAEVLLERKDPAAVVIDEVAGQLIAFMFVPVTVGLWIILSGFVLFRLFDIWKPYPIRRLEALESGLGIMADDILAGQYAAVLLSLIWLVSQL